MRGSRFVAVALGALATLLAGCGGGGGGTTGATTPQVAPTNAPGSGSSASGLVLPGLQSVNSATTYTVYQTNNSGLTQVAITPIGAGPPSSDLAWILVTTGAEILYPDGTVQLTDGLGNFDAALSTWAVANQQTLAANPNAQPEVFVVIPFVTPQAPLDTTVVAYAPAGGPQLTNQGIMRDASGLRRANGSSVPVSELGSVQMYPRGVAMFDNEVRTYAIVGSDSSGDYVNLSQATITWSLGGCGVKSSGAGQITASSKDPVRATYKPPASGTFSTPDLVTATVQANGSTYCTTANAFYYDISGGVSITGTLADSTSKAVPNGIVSFYGGGREFYRGNLLALTDSTGKFTRVLPPNRSMTLVGGQAVVSGGKPSQATWYNLTPNSVNAGGSGTTIAAATYTETSAFQNPFKPLPPVDRAIRDAWSVSTIGTQNFPFNRPDNKGTFKACSLDAIINNVAGSASCATVSNGDYFQGWAAAYVPASGTATQWIFTQPASQDGGRRVMQISSTTSLASVIPAGVNDKNTQNMTCTAPTACWTFMEFYNPIGFAATITAPITSSNGALSGAPNGTILANDGGFNENNVVGGSFTVYMLRNEYSVGHQVQGQGLYSHAMSFSYATPGASVAAISNNWYNAAALLQSTLTFTRTPNANDPGFTFTATGSRTYYKGTTASATLGYSVAGSFNKDRSGQVTVTLTTVPGTDQSSVNSAIAFTYLAPGGTCPTGYPAPQNPPARICGQLTNPNLSSLAGNLGANVVADFTVDSTYYVNVILDSSLGGQISTFHF